MEQDLRNKLLFNLLQKTLQYEELSYFITKLNEIALKIINFIQSSSVFFAFIGSLMSNICIHSSYA